MCGSSNPFELANRITNLPQRAAVSAMGLTEAQEQFSHDTGPLGDLYASFIFSGGYGNSAGGGAEGGAAVGAEAGGEAGSSAGGSMFGPGSADALDSSLIGPGAGAAAGSGSQFAPDAIPIGSPDDQKGDPNLNSDGGTAFINASVPTTTLDPAVADALGISDGFSAQIPGEFGGVGGMDNVTGMVPGGAPSFGDGFQESSGFPGDPGNVGGTGDVTGPSYYNDSGGSSSSAPGYLDKASELLKKIGLSPASAAMLGLAGAQAFSKSKVPLAAQQLQGQAGPNAAAASATIQSGGTASPAWSGQKASIDATIDEQLKQQVAAMMQQAQNSGQGGDSQVTQQQVNKLKQQLETQRQAMYAQAQQQNVQAALQTLGISNQALSQVANQQFQASNQGKQSAAQTAQIALQLEALSRKGGSSSGSVVDQGRKDSA